MTTSAATSASESWLIGQRSSPSSSGIAEVIRAEFAGTRPLPLPATSGLDVVAARYEADANRASALRAARVALAEELCEHKPHGLALLRMRAGLSQAQLAALAGTSQAHIARIEAGKNDPGTSVVARIATALHVGGADTFLAIRSDQVESGQQA